MPPWPRRPRLVAGNWKMNRTASEGAVLTLELRALVTGPACEIALCPPFTALAAVGEALRGSPIHLGAQNLHPEPRGAFTGEVSGPMLAALGCRFVIVGHSERRHLMGEDDALVARKLRAAQACGLTAIVCVGESLAEREADRTAEVLVRQVRAAYDGLDAAAARSAVIAYEPVWAIGTGRVATPADAQEVCKAIRTQVADKYGEQVADGLRVLYGGSVKSGNIAELVAQEDIDGALVGGASLDADEFAKLCALAAGGPLP